MEETASSGLVKGFRMIWAIMKLNLFFVGMTLAGGIVFGIGPAFYTVSSLIESDGLAYEAQTFRKSWLLAGKQTVLSFFRTDCFPYV